MAETENLELPTLNFAETRSRARIKSRRAAGSDSLSVLTHKLSGSICTWIAERVSCKSFINLNFPLGFH